MRGVWEVLRLIVKYFPDGHMEQEGTPREIAQYQFEMLALNTLQSFKNLLDAITTAMDDKKQEKPKRKNRSRKKEVNETD